MARKLITISTLCVVRGGRMLLVRKRGSKMFILPGGKPEPEEDDERAVRREVMEELGCGIADLAPSGIFTDAAGDAVDVDVEVRTHVGTLIGDPRVLAEIEEMAWVSMVDPDVPVAPSLANQILPRFAT